MVVDPQAEETIWRLHRLHGLYDRALMIAAAVIVEAHDALRLNDVDVASLDSGTLHERLLMRATKELTEDGVLPGGRWALFSNEELVALHDVDTLVPLIDEVREEIARRKITIAVPADVPS